nr:MAG TPA: hypothetical protein [Caudoviricetes sp.]
MTGGHKSEPRIIRDSGFLLLVGYAILNLVQRG